MNDDGFYETPEAECEALRAENDRLREALEKAEYQTQRYKDALDKNASFEQLWEEVSNENDRLREALTECMNYLENPINPEAARVRMRAVRALLAKEAGK